MAPRIGHLRQVALGRDLDLSITLEPMSIENLLATLDAEITRLQQARELLAGTSASGRKTASRAKAASVTRPKRVMSAAARKRIAEAQRKRWAAQKKAAAK
jgi:hypothetical protein